MAIKICKIPRSFTAFRMTILLFLCFSANAEAHTWKPIDKGLYYTFVNDIHVFRIDPKQFRFSVVTAKDLKEIDTTAHQVAKRSKAILTINGGFFSPTHKSLGLLIRNGEAINPMHPTHWWHIFQMSKEQASVVPQKSFLPSGDIEMALQAGPRLVIRGEIPRLKLSLARRSGIGVLPNGNVVIAATDNTEMTMEAFARFFQQQELDGGLGCLEALNLDGGGSTQLYFNWKNLEVNVPGISRITNAIVIFPR